MNTEKNGITVRPGCELGDELHSCIEIIKEGEAVNVASATDELPEATFVAVKRVDGLLVGVGAIKRQRHWYARSIAKKSGFPFDENLHELGYVSVRKTHQKQGIATALLESLLSTCKPRPLFATTSNETMKKRLAVFGFKKRGIEWQGEKSPLSLWIKD